MLVKPLVRPICRAIAGRPTASLGTGFAPTSLFADGSIGVLYDNNDLSTLFSDSAGTTPAVVNGPVGLVLDKSQGLVLGAELITNGDFSGGATGWTLTSSSVSGGALSVSSVSTENVAVSTATAPAVSWYYIEFDVTVTSGQLSVFVSQLSASNKFGNNITTSGHKAGWVLVGLPGGSNNAVLFRSEGGFVGTIDNVKVKPYSGNHAYQTTATSRPTLRGTPTGLDGDGTDDALLCASSGGGTTGFLFQAAIRHDVVSKRQTIWSDAGTNTGYKVEINASNQLVFSAGNGTAYTSVTTANTVAAGTTYSVECYDDGTNLVAILNQGTPATAARPTVSAGTAGFTMQKDNGAASGFMDGTLYSVIYLRNTAKNSATRAQAMRWIRQKAGL